jgi:predicted PolB exonuclease-like 3'-5' exonuclease
MTSIVFDVEAVAIDSAGNYLEPVAAPGNYKDPEKIAAYCAQAQQEQLAKAALDIDLGRIVALGLLLEHEAEPTVVIARDEQDERDLLAGFWPLVTRTGFTRPTLVGFNCLGYDLPLMLRRSLYLGVPAPRFQMGKYRHDGIDDLMLTLSFDGAVKYRGLSFYCKRFNIDVPDETSGKDIATLHAAGDWDGIAAHCKADVLKTAKLAQRIGVLQAQPEAVL